MKTARSLSPREHAIIECMLKEPFPGRDEIREQLARAKVRPVDGSPDHDGSLEFEVGEGPKAAVNARVPVDAVTTDSDGVPIEILLHVVDGLLDEMEVYKADGSPIARQPTALDLTVRTY